MAIATPRYAVNATCLPHNNVWQDIEAISSTGGHAVGLLERKFTDGADPRIDRFGR